MDLQFAAAIVKIILTYEQKEKDRNEMETESELGIISFQRAMHVRYERNLSPIIK